MVIISDTGSSIMGISDGIFGYPIYIVGDIMGMHGNINILGKFGEPLSRYLDIGIYWEYWEILWVI